MTDASRLAGGGAVAVGLACAAWRATPEGAAPTPGFLIVNGGLAVFGALLLIAAAVGGWGRRPWTRAAVERADLG
ncbi:MAG: hypothetical protein H0W29_11930, partial [Gemmatimonadales bacterium]|nr:hypothetical protein [Gemmatimonadales bacterium]